MRSLRELAPAHVLYVNSLSKVVGGGLRSGWVAARGPVRDRIAMLKLDADFHSPTLIQHIAARWLATGAYDRHVKQTMPFYRERRDALLAALERHLAGEYHVDPPAGGHHLWVTLDPAARRARALRRGGPPRRDLHARRSGHRRAALADVVPPVVLAARPRAARRGRAAAGARDPRGAPPRPPRRRRRRCHRTGARSVVTGMSVATRRETLLDQETTRFATRDWLMLGRRRAHLGRVVPVHRHRAGALRRRRWWPSGASRSARSRCRPSPPRAVPCRARSGR